MKRKPSPAAICTVSSRQPALMFSETHPVLYKYSNCLKTLVESNWGLGMTSGRDLAGASCITRLLLDRGLT